MSDTGDHVARVLAWLALPVVLLVGAGVVASLVYDVQLLTDSFGWLGLVLLLVVPALVALSALEPITRLRRWRRARGLPRAARGR